MLSEGRKRLGFDQAWMPDSDFQRLGSRALDSVPEIMDPSNRLSWCHTLCLQGSTIPRTRKPAHSRHYPTVSGEFVHCSWKLGGLIGADGETLQGKMRDNGLIDFTYEACDVSRRIHASTAR